MLFLIALALASGFAFFCRKPLKKYPYVFYISAVVITAIISVVDFRNLPVFVNTYIVGLFSRGAFATALWCVVMWAGAFPNGSKPIKVLMPIRGELSIFTAVLTLGHNIGYGKTYFVRLFTDSGRMTSNQITASILTIIMLVIMIPLTIMSFPQIRRKMNAKLWKKIQRTAYIFYALIYIHVMVLCIPMARLGRDGYLFSVIVYSIVFISYAVCRIRKWILVRKKPENKAMLNTVSIFVASILIIAVGIYSKSESRPVSEIKINNQATTTATTATSVTTITTSLKTTTTISADSSTTMTLLTATSLVTESAESTTSVTTISVPEETTLSEETILSEETVTELIEETLPEEIPPEEIPTEEIIITEPETEPEPVYIYQNGTYSASAYGYDGEVHVSVTIENDVITAISGYTDESDSWYFESAQGSVISQILSSQSTSVDAYAGATYSSDAIMSAVQKALDSAKN